MLVCYKCLCDEFTKEGRINVIATVGGIPSFSCILMVLFDPPLWQVLIQFMCIFHNSQPFWEQRSLSLTAHYKYVIWKLCKLSQNIPVFKDSFQNVRLADLRKNTYLGHWNISTLPLYLCEYFSILSTHIHSRLTRTWNLRVSSTHKSFGITKESSQEQRVWVENFSLILALSYWGDNATETKSFPVFKILHKKFNI